MTRDENGTDSDKLRLLADWFDSCDAADHNPNCQVQDDLRRIASTLDGPKGQGQNALWGIWDDGCLVKGWASMFSRTVDKYPNLFPARKAAEGALGVWIDYGWIGRDVCDVRPYTDAAAEIDAQEAQ